MNKTLFSPITLGERQLPNRIVMPPMTRSRASRPGNEANVMMAEYYAQRASAGLIVGEGTQICPEGQGYAWTPGIYTDSQIQGWKKVTDAVHAEHGVIFAQLWHVGRVTHPDNIGGQQPVSASALRAEGVQVFVDNGSGSPGFVDCVEPRALSIEEIGQVVEQYAQAARNAIAAGFDGIELHGANGYLVNQFIDSESNARTDQYGGTLENRLRFLDEVVGAMCAAIGSERVGVRLAPLTTLNGTVDKNPEETYTAAAALLDKHKIAYLHIAEADWDDAPVMSVEFKQAIRSAFSGVTIYAGKYSPERAQLALDQGWADMIAFGRPFVSNPDLVQRIHDGIPWAPHDRDSLFGGDKKGLTDYPTAAQAAAAIKAAGGQPKKDDLMFQPLTVGGQQLANRIAMAPMTRSRTDQPGDIPNALMAEYYAQRASAGLLITEGAPISAVARGYSLTPGIYTQAHIDGWQLVTDAVHAKGGKIFIQLWHVGRRSHESIAGEQPVSASAIKEPDQVFGPLADGGFGMIETGEPRAMSEADIQQTIADFVQAAKNAIAAGFDGVELHGAHGYLLDQFMRMASNQRTDSYGGSAENRLRFTLEATRAVADAIGADKTAIRLSPFVTEGYSQADPEITELTLKLLEQLAPLELAYVHFSENISNYSEMPDSYRERARAVYPHPIMVAGKYTLAKGEQMLERGYADLVAFGQPFITNPDFVYRVQHDVPLTPVGYDAHSTFYGGGAEGYTDYPTALTAD